MEANGWKEGSGADFVLITKDLNDPKAIVQALGTVPSDQEIVLVGSIGQPATAERWKGYTANNLTALKLMDYLGANITDVVTCGYERPGIDEKFVQDHGLTVLHRLSVDFRGTFAAAWIAVRRVSEPTPQPETHHQGENLLNAGA